jgi:molybdate/tungstate transport system substrate-binding protein
MRVSLARKMQRTAIAGLAFLSCLAAVPKVPPAPRTVSLLYAGSLGSLVERGIVPALAQHRLQVQGEPMGSVAAARMMLDGLRRPDVFLSADPEVNRQILMRPPHRLADWYVVFAAGELGIAYRPASRYASLLDAARQGHLAWYRALESPGLLLGRTDPALDPKGYRTVLLFRMAADHYGHPELTKLLGADENPQQIFPEPELVLRLETGQLDAAVLYRHEAVARGLPFIVLPAAINFSDPRFAARYARYSYRTRSGLTVSGQPILFTATIPTAAAHRSAAIALLQFLCSPEARVMFERFGLRPVQPWAEGDWQQLPSELRPRLHPAPES